MQNAFSSTAIQAGTQPRAPKVPGAPTVNPMQPNLNAQVSNWVDGTAASMPQLAQHQATPVNTILPAHEPVVPALPPIAAPVTAVPPVAQPPVAIDPGSGAGPTAPVTPVDPNANPYATRQDARNAWRATRPDIQALRSDPVALRNALMAWHQSRAGYMAPFRHQGEDRVVQQARPQWPGAAGPTAAIAPIRPAI